MDVEPESIPMDLLTRQPSVRTPCFHYLGDMIIKFLTHIILFENDKDIFDKFFTSILHELCKKTVPCPALSGYLLSKSVFTPSNREEWERKVSYDKNCFMYQVIIQKEDIFNCVEALKRTSNGKAITFIAAKIESHFQCSFVRPSGPCTLCPAPQQPSQLPSRFEASAVRPCELASPHTTPCGVDPSLPPNSDTSLEEATAVDVQNHQIRSSSNQEHSGQDELLSASTSSCTSPIDEVRKPMLTEGQEADLNIFAHHNGDLESGNGGFSGAGLNDQSNPSRKHVVSLRKHRNKILGTLVLLAVGAVVGCVIYNKLKSPSAPHEVSMMHTSVESVTSISKPTEISRNIAPLLSDLIVASIVDQRTQTPSVVTPGTTTTTPAELIPTTPTEFSSKGRSSVIDLEVNNDVPATFILEIDKPGNSLWIPLNKNEVTIILQPTKIYNWKSSWNTRNNTEKVTSLILKGKFNLWDIVYFLNIFKNLVKLEISEGKFLCDCLDEFNFDDDTINQVISSITHLVISDMLEPCDNLYRLFTRKIVQIPNVKHLTLENVSIQHENVVLIEKLFQMYENSIQSLLFNVILCSNCILFETLMFPSLTKASFNVNPRYSDAIWTTLENLSVASPNMVTFDSNVLCLQKERNILLKNWDRLYTFVDVCG